MSIVIFDLDGTLVDPVAAMTQAAELTYHEFDLEPPAPEDVAARVGLGARELFAGHPAFEKPARLEAALESYWIHLAERGATAHRLYDGVPLLLARLKRQGHRIYLVTVLPVRYARQVLHHFDLLLAFDQVFGSAQGLTGRTKDELLDQIRAEGVLAGPGLLVGDRGADMATAREHGLRAVGVTYGFARPGELQAAGAEVLFDSVASLDAWLTTELPDPERLDAFSRSE